MEQGDVLRLTSLPVHRFQGCVWGTCAAVCTQSCQCEPRAEGLGSIGPHLTDEENGLAWFSTAFEALPTQTKLNPRTQS